MAIDDSGRFIATWVSSGQDGSGRGVYMRAFDSTGTALGDEELVNTGTGGDQWIAAVSMNGEGEAAITWRDDAASLIYYQRYDADGNATGGPVQVMTAPFAATNETEIAMDDAGNVTLVWEQIGPDGDDYGIVARQFDSEGNALASEFVVNTRTASYQEYPGLAMNGQGEFTVVWIEPDSAGDSSWVPSVEMRQYTTSTTESGGAIAFDIQLDVRPDFDVTIPLSLSDGTEGTLSVTSLTFTPDNWNVAQTVTVTGLDDALADGDVEYRLVFGRPRAPTSNTTDSSQATGRSSAGTMIRPWTSTRTTAPEQAEPTSARPGPKGPDRSRSPTSTPFSSTPTASS